MTLHTMDWNRECVLMKAMGVSETNETKHQDMADLACFIPSPATSDTAVRGVVEAAVAGTTNLQELQQQKEARRRRQHMD
jgi:hypothetical protein